MNLLVTIGNEFDYNAVSALYNKSRTAYEDMKRKDMEHNNKDTPMKLSSGTEPTTTLPSSFTNVQETTGMSEDAALMSSTSLHYDANNIYAGLSESQYKLMKVFQEMLRVLRSKAESVKEMRRW